MPTLKFKGKNVIWNHHLSIPYHTLEEDPKLSFQPKKGEGNLIIEGDNLLALKALLPIYSGRIKCIYIDPPYNTGNEGWIYNDKVNSPLHQEWFGKVVGEDDLTRHDKWLCMLTPRLKILKDLLSDDGIIFISIDDHEMERLKLLIDEIFTEYLKVATFVWHKKYGGGGDNKNLVTEHEYVLCYCSQKNPKLEQVINGIEYDFDDFADFETDENGYYYSATESILMRGPNSTPDKRPNLCYPIIDPDGNRILPRFGKGTWAYEKNTLDDKLGKRDLVWKKIKGNWMLYKKKFLFLEDDEVRDKKPRTILDRRYGIGQTGEGTNRLKVLFNSREIFPNPKPISLIKHLINLSTSTNENSIILDSFAGSGTTAEATIELNSNDLGNRNFILVQMTEASEQFPRKNICKSVTSKRVKLAIKTENYESGFHYLRVGKAMDTDSMLSGELPTFKEFAKYVFYLCTGTTLSDTNKINEKKYFIGKTENTVLYLIYKQDFNELTKLALTLKLAESFIKNNPRKRIIVYAPACFLDQEYLMEKQIEFVNIPYNLFQRNK